MVELLNAGITPCFTDVSSAGKDLVDILTGRGISCYFNNSKMELKVALNQSGLMPISLSLYEANILLYGQFAVTGACALIIGCAANLSPMFDVVAALSCEASGVSVEAFDASHFEVSRPHRGQISSAATLRLLLEGSKCTNSSQVTVLRAFSSTPQVHGPAQDALVAAIKMMELELNCTESVDNISGPDASLDPTQSYMALNLTMSALSAYYSISRERWSVLSGISQGQMSGKSIAHTQDLSGAFDMIVRLSSALSEELYQAVRRITVKDGSSKPAASTEPIAGKGVEIKRPGTGTGTGIGIAVQEDASLTPEQRARIEAKRREKALKAEQKAKAKEVKKGSAGLVLGVGTSLLRTHLSSLCPDPCESSFSSVVTPFDTSEKSFSCFCSKLLEQVSSGGRHKPKIPKGTRDFTPEQMRVREQAFAVIRRVFKRHGAVEIDTPVFELREVLMGKYGEDSKLIYDLSDQGGELLSLRYDLTVPFARFLAMNSVGNIKRFHISKVYRRDNPQLAKGRYREFYQCDFDVAGSFLPMVPDAEVITVACEILSELPIGAFMVKLNHRGILDAVFEISGVPAEKFRTICSAVDKLDKASWSEVRLEMVEEKGLDPDVADRIGQFVLHHGEPIALWEKLTTEQCFGAHERANTALREMKILFDYLKAMNSLKYVHFDLSLARGLDYYTGVIYEVVLVDGGSSGVSVGSIAAGGRYDNLVGMFSTSGQQTPCVGVSIGIERVFAIMERKAVDMGLLKSAYVQVFVASIGTGLVPDRMRVCKLLWEANISAEYSHQENPKFKKQLDETLERGIPYMIVFGEEELKNGTVKVKDMREHAEEEVPLEAMVTTLLSKGCTAVPAGADMNFLNAMKQA